MFKYIDYTQKKEEFSYVKLYNKLKELKKQDYERYIKEKKKYEDLGYIPKLSNK